MATLVIWSRKNYHTYDCILMKKRKMKNLRILMIGKVCSYLSISLTRIQTYSENPDNCVLHVRQDSS